MFWFLAKVLLRNYAIFILISAENDWLEFIVIYIFVFIHLQGWIVWCITKVAFFMVTDSLQLEVLAEKILQWSVSQTLMESLTLIMCLSFWEEVGTLSLIRKQILFLSTINSVLIIFRHMLVRFNIGNIGWFKDKQKNLIEFQFK